MIICVTGTPGTGKTTLAKKLADDLKNLKTEYIDGNKIIKKHNLSEGIDKKKDCMIIDEQKFTDSAIKECKKDSINIIDSHLSHHLPKNKVKFCIVCKSELKELKKRLEKREYSEEKIRENMDVEIFDTCLIEAQEKGHETFIYDDNYDELIKKIKSL